MTFPINVSIPDEDNDPLDDVAPMRNNFANIKSYLTLNHVAPGSTNAGFHSRVDWVAPISPSAPTGTQGVDYTGAGIAQPSVPQRFFQNANNTFPLSCVKAYGRILCATPAFQQSFNTTGAPLFSGGGLILEFNLVANLVSNNAVVIATVTYQGVGTQPFIQATSILANKVSITFTGSPVAEVVNFIVLEM